MPPWSELVSTRPYTIVDAGHNPASMTALRDTLAELLGGRRLVLLFGMLATKDYRAVTALIAPLADQVVTTRPDNPHALTAEDLAAEVRRHTPSVVAIEDRALALAEARRLTGPDDVLVITGSFYMVGEVRARLLQILKTLEAGDLAVPPLTEVRNLRAVAVLERLASADALAILRDLAAGAPDAALTRAARGALERVDPKFAKR